MKNKLLLLFFGLICTLNVFSQHLVSHNKRIFDKRGLKPVARQILTAQRANKSFYECKLFNRFENDSLDHQLKYSVDSFAVLSVQQVESKKLLSARPQYLKLTIPVYRGKDLEILLMQHKLTTDDFSVEISGGEAIPGEEVTGLHYWGIINGCPNSSVAVSILDNEVIGIISAGYGNIVLGKLKDSDQHIIYNDISLKGGNTLLCGNNDDEGMVKHSNSDNSKKGNNNYCVRLYWEINYDIFQSKGTVANTISYAFALFNQSQILYANDDINVLLSGFKIWSSASPYGGVTSFDWLASFQNNTGFFYGDLAHLMTFSNTTGGLAAKIGSLCYPDPDSSKCFSGLKTFYSNVPTYSFTIYVITHEQAHLMGSRHTHACVWNGNNTRIDGCGPAAGYNNEGNCPAGPIPSMGTIMSYCHLSPNPGINFNLGFGSQPRNVILNEISGSNCLDFCYPCSPSTGNDFCFGPTFPQGLSVGTSCNLIDGTTCNATQSFSSGNSCSLTELNANTYDVWYAFAATCQNAVIRVESGSNFDAVVELYYSACGAIIDECIDDFSTGETEEFEVTGMTPGVNYYIRVYDWLENKNAYLPGGTDFQICISADPCLANLTLDPNSSSNNLTINGNVITSALDIINNGGANTGNNSTLTYYLSTDKNINIFDYAIGTNIIGNLSPGGHVVKNFSVNICNVVPSIPNGVYYLGYLLDTYDDVNESDENDNNWYETVPLTVNCCTNPSAPGALSSNSPQCSNVTITRTGNPPAGVTWYWQGTTCGTNTNLGSDQTFTATTSGTYYLRAYHNSSQCWSANCSSINVTIGGTTSDPPAPSSNSPQCSNVTITRTGNPPAGVTWYWQGTTCGTSMSLGSGQTYTATTSGTYYLRAYDINGQCWSANCAGITVTIGGMTSAPPTPISNSPQCSSVTITRTGNPAPGITWFWQGTTCGTNTGLGSGVSYTATASGTYYLRAYDNTAQCWSTNCASINVIVGGTNSDPGIPVSNSPQCGNVTITRTANPPPGVTWYWQGLICGTNTSLGSDITYTATTSGTYFLRAYDDIWQCWSPSCVGVDVLVLSPPNEPGTPISNSPQCGNVTITRTGNPTPGITWYWQGNTCGTNKSFGSGTSYTATSSGTYYIRAYDNIGQCWSPDCSEINVIVAGLPGEPEAPVSNSPQCNNITITRTGNPSPGITWYWQGNTCGTNMSLGSGATYTATSSGTYYLRAYNNAGQCWSANCTGTNVSVEEIPADPANPTAISPQCNSVTVTRTGTPPPNITWYWQGTNCGTNMGLGSGPTYMATNTGVYYLRAYNNQGQCWSVNCGGVPLAVNQSPVLSSLKLSKNYLIISPVNITDIVQWYFEGNLVPGSGDSLLCIGNGNYYCVVTNAFGCSATSNILNVSPCSVATNELYTKSVISIFPNPADDQLNIKAEEINNGNYELILVNTLGQRLKREFVKVTDRSFEIHVGMKELPGGFYLLTVGSEDIKQIFKVIKH